MQQISCIANVLFVLFFSYNCKSVFRTITAFSLRVYFLWCLQKIIDRERKKENEQFQIWDILCVCVFVFYVHRTSVKSIRTQNALISSVCIEYNIGNGASQKIRPHSYTGISYIMRTRLSTRMNVRMFSFKRYYAGFCFGFIPEDGWHIVNWYNNFTMDHERSRTEKLKEICVETLTKMTYIGIFWEIIFITSK